MKPGPKIDSKGVEEARKALPAILDAAAAGRVTIITRRGSAVAAVVPAHGAAASRPASLLALAGSGKGLWGRDPAAAVARLRDEWSR
jgi:antitoxin (DNA-binding transcriptional repressor) of toxin-antitoxin stability system